VRRGKAYSDEKVANRNDRFWHGATEWCLNDGQIPNFRVVRVHVSTLQSCRGKSASRNGLVSDLPPEILTSRFRNFSIAGRWWRRAVPECGGGEGRFRLRRRTCRRASTRGCGTAAAPSSPAACLAPGRWTVAEAQWETVRVGLGWATQAHREPTRALLGPSWDSSVPRPASTGEKVRTRIVTCGRSLTRPFRDARRFPSPRL
jgi:hypothetical protein